MTREEELRRIEAFAAEGRMTHLATLNLDERIERLFAVWRAERKAMRNANAAYVIVRRGRRRRRK